MFRVVLRLGSFRVVNGWVGLGLGFFLGLRDFLHLGLGLEFLFFFIPGFFLEIITLNVFSGTFYAGVDCC